MRHKLLLASSCFLISVCSCLVPPASEQNSLAITGTVEAIEEGGEKDVVIKLAGDENMYYINRGLERGLTLPGMKEALLGKEVTLKYPDMWIDLSTHPLYYVRCGEEVIYSEMPDRS